MTSEEQQTAAAEEEASPEVDAKAEALRIAKGKAPKGDNEVAHAGEDDEDDDEEVEFDADEDSDDDDDDGESSDEEDELEATAGGEAEVEELEGGEGDQAGPSSGSKRKRPVNTVADDEPQIVAGLSGDEVDPGLIISGGRGSRRGRAGGSGCDARAKYAAKAQVDSDEDEW